MKVITENDIVYYNGDGKGMEKLKGLFKKKEGGTAVGNLVRGLTKGKGGAGAEASNLSPEQMQSQMQPVEPVKKGLSVGAWIGIGAGGLVLVGTIIYFATKKK